MSSEAELVMSIWENMRDHLPNAKRPDLAKDLLYAFAEFGFDAADLSPIIDEDHDLTTAYEAVFVVEDDDESFDEED
jgi:hypothetical protein